ncbi:MAG: hypothetical protein H7A38_02465 [Chlamydiales bacterium]|nr:hypothetical protein [Chlamydiales bacterium]
MNLMYEETSLLDSLWSVDETAHFIAYLARQGVSKWDTASQEELEHDIAWLLDDNDHSDLENEPYWLFSSQVAQAPIYLTLNDTSRPEILLCKSWVSKKWQKTKKFTKKHGKVIAIAAAVIVVAAVIIVVTNGAATPAVAVAAAASLDNQNDPINKAGEVRFKDDPSPEHEPEPEVRPSNPPITYQPTPEPIPTFTKEEKLALRESFQEKKEILKETLSEELPPEPLNIPPQDQPDYSQSLFDKTREKGAQFAHHLVEFSEKAKDTVSVLTHESVEGALEYFPQNTSDTCHEKIDEFFGTDFASWYTEEARAKKPKINMGELPPPSKAVTEVAEGVTKVAKNIVKPLARSTTAVGTAVTTSQLLPSAPLYSPQEIQIRNSLVAQGHTPPPRPANIPNDWVVKPSDKNGGIRYRFEIPRKTGEATVKAEVRVMPGNPNSPQPSHRSPYVVHNVNGKYYDKNGNEVSLQTAEAHIPLEEYDFNEISKRVPHE